MDRRQVEATIEQNTLFSIKMADGREYAVPHRDYISLPPKGDFVVVYGDEVAHILPLINATGITYAEKHG